jgi:hypothetical protein
MRTQINVKNFCWRISSAKGRILEKHLFLQRNRNKLNQLLNSVFPFLRKLLFLNGVTKHRFLAERAAFPEVEDFLASTKMGRSWTRKMTG